MSQAISPVPSNSPVADKQGMPTQVLVGFLTDLWNRAGGSNASSNTELQNQINTISASPATSIKGNNTGSPATTKNLTPAQVNSILPVFTSLLNGLVPYSGGGTANFLRADGRWEPPGSLDSFISSKISTQSTAMTSGTFTTASNSPGFSVTPNFSGKYKVYASIPTHIDGVSSGKAAVRIFNTSGAAVLLAESQAYVSGVTASVPFQASIFAQSVYTLVAGDTYIFDFQGAVLSGTDVIVDGLDSPFYIFAERVS